MLFLQFNFLAIMDWISLLFHVRSMVPARQEFNSYWFVLHAVTRFFWSLRLTQTHIGTVCWNWCYFSRSIFPLSWNQSSAFRQNVINYYIGQLSFDYAIFGVLLLVGFSFLFWTCPQRLEFVDHKLLKDLLLKLQTRWKTWTVLFSIFCKHFAVWVERQHERNKHAKKKLRKKRIDLPVNSFRFHP